MSNPQPNVTAYLATQKKTTNKELAAEWTLIEELYNEKLDLGFKFQFSSCNTIILQTLEWADHQTGDLCAPRILAGRNCAAAALPEFPVHLRDQVSRLLQMTRQNLMYCICRINPYGLIQILEVVVDNIGDKKEAIEFLEKMKDKVKICDEAVWYLQVMQGNLYLSNLNDLNATKKIIEELRDVLEEAGNVTPVHGKYYMLASQYYRRVGKHSDYYRCGLQFLGCSMDEYPRDQWAQQAFFLGLAALLGDGVYNIGELLAHPILESLKGTENEWLMELLKAFNTGDINKCVVIAI